MPFNDRLIDTEEAAAVNGGGGTGNQEEGLRVHLDANDVDSYDGDGSIWYDIADHEYTPATDVSEHFNTVIYSGTGANNNQITGVGFKPDLIWIKRRNLDANHYIVDALRGNGTSTYKNLSSNTTGAEATTTTNGITNDTIVDGGFTMQGTGARTNANGTDNYVAWCFKAGGAPSGSDKVSVDGTSYATMSAAGLTEGSVNINKLSVNTELGFSIATYNGNDSTGTVAHGLGQKPELIIIKAIDHSAATSWTVFHDAIPATKYLTLNTTDAATTASNRFNNTEPTSTVWSFGTSDNVHTTNEHVVYSFASKRGVSKVGSYKGTGSGGNKVVTGFEPAFIIQKSDAGSGWVIIDSKRNDKYLQANTNGAEAPLDIVDFNRDGFTLKGNNMNGSGVKYIYLAFAKNTNETSLIPDTDLELHLDADSFPEKGESGYSNTPSTWTDSSGNSNNGTISGATFDSELGNWLDFDGSDDYISVPSTSSTPVDFSAKNYTIEAWINPDTTPALGSPIFTKYGTSDSLRSIKFDYDGSGKLKLFERATGTNASHFSTTILTLNRWTHVAVTRTSSQVKFYIDGSLDATVSSTFTPNNGGSQNINIGSQANGQFNFFNGQIGQVRVYDTALTDSDISQNFNFTKNDYPNGSNATRIGATFSPSTTPNYWSFDGINDAMLLSTTSTLLGDTNNIKTISAFVTLSSTSARGHIYSVSASNNSNDFFYIGWFSDTNKVHISSRDGSSSNSFTHSAPLTAVANTWKHICITGGDGNTPKIYANGVELTVTSSTSGTATNASWINYPSYSGTVYTYVGKLRQYLPASTHWHNGRIGQVKLYDETLTSTEVLALFNAEKDTYGL